MMPRKFYEWRVKLPCISEKRGKLSAYLDDELDARARIEVEKHLAGCSRCQVEFDQLRFASRAMSHFVAPEKHAPVRQTNQFAERSQGLPVAGLSRFWDKKIAVPVPVAVVGLAAIVIAALFLGRLVQQQTSSVSQLANIKTPEIKIVEVPVERVVTVERVVNRTIYVRQSRPPRMVHAGGQLVKDSNPLVLSTKGASGIHDVKKDEQKLFTFANMAGFRPVQDSNLRIVKELDR